MSEIDKSFDWQTKEERQAQIDQAIRLREQASRRGLKFETYLVPSIAEKVLDDIAQGGFHDPSEFVFIASQVFLELEQYPDLKKELLKRKIQAGIDSGEGRPAEEVFAELKSKMAEWEKEIPATWEKPTNQK